MKKNIIIYAMFMAVAVLFSSCEEDDLRQSLPQVKDGLLFKIVVANNIDTKAPSDSHFESVDLSTDEIPLFVTTSVEVNRSHFGNTMPETKGATIDKATLLDDTESKGIPLTMITSASGSTTYKSGWLRKNNDNISDDYWSLYNTNAANVTNDDKINWEEITGAKASFFSYYDRDAAVSSVDCSNLSFTYTGNSSNFTLGTDTDVKATDAEKSNDLLVAYTADVDHMTAHGTPDQVNSIDLHYYHPLAAVRFIAPSSSGISISRVAIKNLKTKGTVTYNTSMTSFKDAFTWTNLDVKKDYSQKFSSTVDDMTFFVVPQALDSIVVTFNLVKEESGTLHEFQVSAPGSILGTKNGKWDQGYIYIYTLDTNSPTMVDVDIVETFSDGDKVKKNVAVENKSHSTVFVRAKALANWCSESGKVLAPCEISSASINTTDWLLGKDGFYYCKVPVVGFHQSPVFITSFTQPADISDVPNGAMIKNLHVEMVIVSQGIECDSYSPTGTTYIKKAWGDENQKILLNDNRDLLTILKF